MRKSNSANIDCWDLEPLEEQIHRERGRDAEAVAQGAVGR